MYCWLGFTPDPTGGLVLLIALARLPRWVCEVGGEWERQKMKREVMEKMWKGWTLICNAVGTVDVVK